MAMSDPSYQSTEFERFLLDLEIMERRRWYGSKLFEKLEKRLRDKRRKKYGR